MLVNQSFDFCAGLAQCTEIYNQLLGRCGVRQVAGAKIGLQHNLGLGGAVVVALYKRGFPPNRYAKIWPNIYLFLLIAISEVQN